MSLFKRDPDRKARTGKGGKSAQPDPSAPVESEDERRFGILARPIAWLQRLFQFFDRNAHFLIVALIILALVAFYWFSTMFVVIHSGEAGVLYRIFRGGTVIERVFGEGFHIVRPWNKMYIYNVRIQTRLHDLTVITNKGLPITLTLAIRYRPQRELLGVMHREVGPNYVDTIIVPQIESVLRKNIGQEDPETIYANKGGILNDIILLALEEASRKFVEIDDIIIRTVTLPTQVRGAIEEKLVQQQHEQAYEFILAREEKEAERKRIEARGIRDYQALVRETLDKELIQWQGVRATQEIAKSDNAKVVIIGAGEEGLPIILGNQ